MMNIELRNQEDVKVIKSIVHIIDKYAGEPIYSEDFIENEVITGDFLPAHIIKTLSISENSKAQFFKNECLTETVRDSVERIFAGTGSFIEESKIIAKRMMSSVRKIESDGPFDLCISLIDVAGELAISIMKFDYKLNYVHNVDYEGGLIKISIAPQEIGIQTSKQKLSNAAIILNPGENRDYDMLIMNKKGKDEEGNFVDFFMDYFLQADEVADSTSKTIAFKKITEKFIRGNTRDDIQAANELRDIVNTALLENAYIDVNDIVRQITNSNEEVGHLQEMLLKYGIPDNDKFEINKVWIEKKLNIKNIKTDTGISIKGCKEFFNDKMRFEMVYNGDGTVDYVIKNVRNIVQ